MPEMQTELKYFSQHLAQVKYPVLKVTISGTASALVTRYMKLSGMAVVVGLVLAAQVQAAASPLDDEAQALTRDLRRHDRYARVLATEQWRKRLVESADSLSVAIMPIDPLTGYIRIRDFYASSVCNTFNTKLAEFKKRGVKRMILDLRGNPGGQRLVAVCVAGLLIGPRPIFSVRSLTPSIPELEKWTDEDYNPQGTKLEFRAQSPQQTSMPIVLIQDRQTASAAEILSAALRDYRRAWIIGTRTFGKGRSQEWNPMRDRPDLMISFTINELFSPLGLSFEGKGVAPTALPHSVRLCTMVVMPPARNADPQLIYALKLLNCVSK
jgi:hypothetical protein